MKYSNENPPIVCMQKNSTCYQGTTRFTPRGILWHDTDAGNPYISRYVQPHETDADYEEKLALLGKNRYGNDWNHKPRQAGMNAFIGKLADGTVTSVQTMPWNYIPWGCGAGKKGSLNGACLQFEICDDGYESEAYFRQVYEEACQLTAYLCQLYDLDPLGTFVYNGVEVPVITSHAESYALKLGCNHGDPLKWLKKYGKTMDDVRRDVAALMGIAADVPETPTEPVKPEAKRNTLIVRTLRKGDSGDDVKAMQILLEGYGEPFPKYGPDGHFGDETEFALNLFQAERFGEPVGICDEKTWENLLGLEK
jgi:hypothetical protein